MLTHMKENIFLPPTTFINAHLAGPAVIYNTKCLADLKGIFEDIHAFEKMSHNQTAYEVDVFFPVKEGTEGGLFFGLTHLYPGVVGEEYFMTKGHFHAVENRAEYYWGIEGEGILLLMDKKRDTKAEYMFPGSLHYIPGFTAHRVVNTSSSILSFGACWPADAGYNYETIATEGFSKRVKKIGNKPVLV